MNQIMEILHGLLVAAVSALAGVLWRMRSDVTRNSAQLEDARDEIKRLRNRLNGVSE